MIALLLLALCGETPHELNAARYYKRAEEMRERVITYHRTQADVLTKKLKLVKRARVSRQVSRESWPSPNQPPVFPSATAKQDAATKLEDEIDRHSKAAKDAAISETPPPPLLGPSLAQGDIGRPLQLVAVQVLDDSSVLAKLVLAEPPNPRSSVPVLNEVGSDVVIWLEVSTKGITDGSSIETDDVFECVGTRQYTLASGGTKTVWHLKKWDLPARP